MPGTWYIRGGRIVDPAAGRDEPGDLFVKDGLIAGLPRAVPAGAGVIDAAGLVVAPGLIDLHTHMREPGGEDAETIASASAAAARGGFVAVVAMPNTSPPLDTAEQIAFVRRRGEETGLVRVLPAGCVTKRRKGREVADLEAMAEAGAVAFTDDGSCVSDEDVMRSAMTIARGLGLPIMDHALDPVLAGNGVMHEGAFSRKLNLPGIPSDAESSIVERDALLAAETGCRVHIQHVSAAESLAALRKAASRNAPVTCEATPHHLALTDADVRPGDAALKVNPPLRGRADRDALRAAVAAGEIQAFATDHAPHAGRAKAKGFLAAPFGTVGLETAVGVTFTLLVKPGTLGLARWLEMWTTGPAAVLGLPRPGLAPGGRADIVLLDLDSEWTVRAGGFLSGSRNTAFEGRTLAGRAVCTLCGGGLSWGKSDGRVDTRGRI